MNRLLILLLMVGCATTKPTYTASITQITAPTLQQ